jgi:hypothetical protein
MIRAEEEGLSSWSEIYGDEVEHANMPIADYGGVRLTLAWDHQAYENHPVVEIVHMLPDARGGERWHEPETVEDLKLALTVLAGKLTENLLGTLRVEVPEENDWLRVPVLEKTGS